MSSIKISTLSFVANDIVSVVNGRDLTDKLLFFLKFLTAILITLIFAVFWEGVLKFFNCLRNPDPTVPSPAIPTP